MESVKNISLLSILSIALFSMLLATQSQAAFAGVSDVDNDGFPSQYTCGNINCDPDDFDPCNPDPNGQACMDQYFELVVDIENIIDDVENLVEDGDLDINPGQLNAVLQKLDKAIDKVTSGNFNAAINALNAFINQVNAFLNSGSISSEDAQIIIDGTQSIIDSLS